MKKVEDKGSEDSQTSRRHFHTSKSTGSQHHVDKQTTTYYAEHLHSDKSTPAENRRDNSKNLYVSRISRETLFVQSNAL